MSQKTVSNLCNLCGGARVYLVHQEKKKPPVRTEKPAYAISETHTEKPDKIVRCMTCGLVYAVPRGPVSEIIQDYARMEDPEYVSEEKGRRKQAQILLNLLAKYKTPGKILDVGCGPGLFLSEAKKRGWRVQGVDLSPWAKKYAAENFGVDVFEGSLSEASFPDKSFDVVVMNDVIEHLEDPKSALRQIRRVLKNDGVLYLSTPDIDSFLSKLLRAKWWGINKYHLFYFSRKSLEKMFHETGFRSIHHAPYPRVFSWNYWVKRLETYPAWVHYLPEKFSRSLKLGNRLLKINLYDQLGVLAKKFHQLENLDFDEKAEERPPQKMKVTVVLPAYNAAKTLERTVRDIPRNVVDEIILVDDASKDETVALAKKLGLVVFVHPKNGGYGANQKTCYKKALERGADVVVMCHPDYQYDPKIIPQLIEPILRGEADAVFGSRMMKGGALEGGMPLWKHSANILLTAFENVVLGTYLTEYHSGFRAYSSKLLKTVRYEDNSDSFIFDTEIIVQAHAHHFKIDEVPIRTRYFEEASSIKLGPSIIYGLGILRTMMVYKLHTANWRKSKKLESKEVERKRSRLTTRNHPTVC